ncbi:MAG: DNA polymerase III subunit delta [Gammaproteobacteria bacterium]|nr:MAG: DNA polymerase III subunit delta [Gammaproteobacteria bacterium]
MQLKPQELAGHLHNGLVSAYLIGGDEPLLVDEACMAIRHAAKKAGFQDRQVFNVDRSFDWIALAEASRSLSLFAERRLLELRIPNARPGDAGRKYLQAFLENPPDDTLLLVICGKVDKATRNTKWIKALDHVGVVSIAYPVVARELPTWITQRLKARGLVAEPGVLPLLTYHFEGNLLALAQEIDKLSLLVSEGRLSVADIEHNLSDNARFSVYALVDACLQGDAAAALRILNTLRAEGTEPVLIIWALARESRNMVSIARQLQGGDNEAYVFQKHQVWSSRRALVKQALKRSSGNHWLLMLRRAARADRILKGRLSGDVWQELQCLGLAMSGFRSRTCLCV